MTVVYMIAGAVIFFGGWQVSLYLYPYAPCRWCSGGKTPGSDKKRWGPCRRCGGSGRRLRWGARER